LKQEELEARLQKEFILKMVFSLDDLKIIEDSLNLFDSIKFKVYFEDIKSTRESLESRGYNVEMQLALQSSPETNLKLRSFIYYVIVRKGDRFLSEITDAEKHVNASVDYINEKLERQKDKR